MTIGAVYNNINDVLTWKMHYKYYELPAATCWDIIQKIYTIHVHK